MIDNITLATKLESLCEIPHCLLITKLPTVLVVGMVEQNFCFLSISIACCKICTICPNAMQLATYYLHYYIIITNMIMRQITCSYIAKLTSQLVTYMLPVTSHSQLILATLPLCIEPCLNYRPDLDLIENLFCSILFNLKHTVM